MPAIRSGLAVKSVTKDLIRHRVRIIHITMLRMTKRVAILGIKLVMVNMPSGMIVTGVHGILAMPLMWIQVQGVHMEYQTLIVHTNQSLIGDTMMVLIKNGMMLAKL